MFARTAAFLFRYLLALSIAFAPTLPAFASSVFSADEHATHAGHVYVDAGAKVSSDPAKPHSGQHNHCNGHCCLACGMSVVGVPVVWSNASRVHPVQLPTVGRFHPHPIVTIPHRPPRTLS